MTDNTPQVKIDDPQLMITTTNENATVGKDENEQVVEVQPDNPRTFNNIGDISKYMSHMNRMVNRNTMLAKRTAKRRAKNKSSRRSRKTNHKLSGK